MTDQDKTALLSKLRAPVASLPSQTRWPVLRAMSTNYTAGKHVWDALDAQACAKGAEEIKQLRAAISALASAPAHGDAIDISRERVDETANDRHEVGAPVAGEAQPVGRVRHFNYSGIARNGFSQEAVLNDDAPSLPDETLLYAAPQASEAVRQQSAGDVVAVLVYKSKGRPGAHGQTLGANGAGEFAVLYRGDEFAALVKANEEIRALEAAGHRLDFAAIIHGEGYSGPMLRQEYVTRAALSAQPSGNPGELAAQLGAQKEQSE